MVCALAPQSTLVIAVGGFALATGRLWWPLAMPLAGDLFVWLAHFTIEKNRPATFTYPLWSLAADFRMWWLWLTARLGPELERAWGGAGWGLGVVLPEIASAFN